MIIEIKNIIEFNKIHNTIIINVKVLDSHK